MLTSLVEIVINVKYNKTNCLERFCRTNAKYQLLRYKKCNTSNEIESELQEGINDIRKPMIWTGTTSTLLQREVNQAYTKFA